MALYRHTQMAGWVIIAPIGLAILATGYFGFFESHIFCLALCLFFLIILTLFFSLRVIVDKHSVRIIFGAGIIRKRIRLSGVQSCRPVRSKWYYGWGIRIIPGGMLYNISGLDAVELIMANGHKYRIGTNEPDRLNGVIDRILRERRQPFES